ncbi:MAG: hypothetical protein Q9165_008614 [Trypethelium subeluteriae]
MRVHLSIHRQELPAANLVWSLPDDQTGPTTIAQLIEDVNSVVPLESMHWGLEDYVVQLGSIRPLQTEDLRARTLSGRHQITADGRHLYDGIPFGRPYLKRPVRPEIHIPGRREYLPTIANDDENTVVGLIDSSDTEGMHSSQEMGQVASREREGDDDPLALTDGSTKERRVHFMGEDHDQAQAFTDAGSDSEASEDYSPSQTDSDDEEDETEDTDELSSSSDTTSDTSTDHSSTTESSEAESSEAETHLAGQVNGETLVNGDSVCSSQSVDPVAPAQPTQVGNPPRQGNEATKARNLRRTRAKKLSYYKQKGALQPNANFEALQRFLPSLRQHDPEGGAPHIDRETTSNEIRRAKGTPPIEQSHESGDSPQALKTTEIIGLLHDPEGKDAEAENGDSSTTNELPPEHISEQSIKRQIRPLRLDMPAANRLIRGSLGVKAKKTPVNGSYVSNSRGEDQTREARPQVVVQSGSRDHREAPSGQPQAPSEPSAIPQDPDYWRSKINLRVRECVLSNHTPRVPSFPYHHPLPPSSVVGKRKRSQKHYDSQIVMLPYDEEDIEDDREEVIEEDREEGIEEDGEEDIEERPTKTRRIDTAFPEFPTDIGSLPALTSDNIGVGIIIAFRLMELVDGCPEISTKYRMAKVVDLTTPGNELELDLAEEYDTQMHEVTEEGTLRIELQSLIEPRLIA